MKLRASTLIAIALVVYLLVWLGRVSDEWRHSYSFTGPQSDYANLLIRGFLKGQLSMDAPVHPDLFSPDPAVRRAAPYLLDASLYEGKYYLYFGVVPPLLTLLPYTWLTGHHLSLNVVTVLYCVLGYFALARLFVNVRERCFPTLGPVANFTLLAFLGFGTGIPFLVIRSSIYEFTIAGAFCMVSVALWAMFRAWWAERPFASVTGASLALGLAVGCRPNVGLLLPVFFLAALALFWRRFPTRTAALRATVLSTMVPAGLIGLGLAWYNFQRFGSPFEFGFNHQLAALLQQGYPLAKVSFFWPNLQWYYLTPPVLQEYFPYVLPIDATNRPADYYGWEDVHGHFLTVVAGLIALALAVGRPRPTAATTLVGPARFVFASFIVAYLSLGFFCSRASRYTVDFNTFLSLWVTVASAPFLLRESGRTWLRLPFLGLLGAIATLDFLGGIESIQLFEKTRPLTFARLSSLGNLPSAWAQRAGLTQFGPVTFTATFAAGPSYRRQALIATGTVGKSDVLWASVSADARSLVLTVEHQGYGELPSDPVPIEPGQPYHFEVDLGSLYPPAAHPLFSAWKADELERLRTTFRVKLNGQVVHIGRSAFYAAPAHTIRLPGPVFDHGVPSFITVANVQRLPFRDIAALDSFSEIGVWRARIKFEGHPLRVGAPMLASGVTGKGNLLSLWLASPHEAKVGHDQWGAGYVASEAFPFDSTVEHTIEIFVGAQVEKTALRLGWPIKPEALAAQRNTVRVWIDGHPIWSTKLATNFDTYDFTQMGSNRQGFSSATTYLTGTTLREKLSPDEVLALVEKNLALP